MALKIYVEGGGDSKEQRIRCREGFRKLLEKAGFEGRMPGIVAGGSRQDTYDKFATAAATDGDAVLLVDSEDPVTRPRWEHLRRRDGWERPAGCDDDQVQLMVTCMETWIVADRAALQRVFGACLRENALPPLHNLEGRNRHDVQDALEAATSDCGRTKQYRKGNRSFQVLAELGPDTLKDHLPHFQGLIDMLEDKL